MRERNRRATRSVVVLGGVCLGGENEAAGARLLVALVLDGQLGQVAEDVLHLGVLVVTLGTAEIVERLNVIEDGVNDGDDDGDEDGVKPDDDDGDDGSVSVDGFDVAAVRAG